MHASSNTAVTCCVPCLCFTGTPHSFISRVSDQTVLQRCRQSKLSHKLHYQQLVLIHKIAILPDDDVTRQIVFKPSCFDLLAPAGPRKRGRPRNCWTNQVYQMALQIAGIQHQMQELWQQPPHVWQQHAKRYCSRLS